MSALEDTQVTEEWAVVYFPPDAPDRTKVFTKGDAETKARTFADEHKEYCPILEHRVVTTTTVTETVPL